MEKELIQSINKLIDILNELATDMRSMKNRLDELYIAIFGLAEKEGKKDKTHIILTKLENGEITAQEARRQLKRLKEEI